MKPPGRLQARSSYSTLGLDRIPGRQAEQPTARRKNTRLPRHTYLNPLGRSGPAPGGFRLNGEPQYVAVTPHIWIATQAVPLQEPKPGQFGPFSTAVNLTLRVPDTCLQVSLIGVTI